MSQESLEAVRRTLAAFDSGDVEQVLASVHPEFEARIAPELSPEPDTYRGVSGVQLYFDSFREAFEQIRFEVEELTEAGDAVAVGLRMTAIGKLTASLSSSGTPACGPSSEGRRAHRHLRHGRGSTCAPRARSRFTADAQARVRDPPPRGRRPRSSTATGSMSTAAHN